MSTKLFKALKKGFEEAIAHDQGKIDLRAEFLKIPKPVHYKAKDIKKIREKSRYSQNVFAQVLNVSVKTVQSWESGQRVPSQAALRLLEIVDKGIYQPEIYRKN